MKISVTHGYRERNLMRESSRRRRPDDDGSAGKSAHDSLERHYRILLSLEKRI